MTVEQAFRQLVVHCEECGDDSTAFFNAKAVLDALDLERRIAAFNSTYDANARRRGQYDTAPDGEIIK